MEKIIEGLEYKTKLAKITMRGVIDRPGVAAEVFSALGQHGLNVEFISTSSVGHGRAEIMFAVMVSEMDNVINVLELVKEKFGTREISVDKECALITLYGSLLATTPGIAGKIFSRLAEHKINIEMINASLSGLSIVVKKENIMEAVGAIRTEFGV